MFCYTSLKVIMVIGSRFKPKKNKLVLGRPECVTCAPERCMYSRVNLKRCSSVLVVYCGAQFHVYTSVPLSSLTYLSLFSFAFSKLVIVILDLMQILALLISNVNSTIRFCNRGGLLAFMTRFKAVVKNLITGCSLITCLNIKTDL